MRRGRRDVYGVVRSRAASAERGKGSDVPGKVAHGTLWRHTGFADNVRRVRRKPPAFVIYLALAGLTLAAYAAVRGFGFVDFDDYQYVANNAQVARGLSLDNMAWAFST